MKHEKHILGKVHDYLILEINVAWWIITFFFLSCFLFSIQRGSTTLIYTLYFSISIDYHIIDRHNNKKVRKIDLK